MNSALTEISQRMAAARMLARAAGNTTLQLFQTERLQVDFKHDCSPVTAADRHAEKFLREAILEQFPNDGVLGEELGEVTGGNDFRWVLDPIDGTKSFITGVPLYGTMVGLELAGEAIAGVIYFPALNEMIYGSRGEGCWTTRHEQPPRRAKVSNKTDLSECALMITDAKSFSARDAHAAYLALEQAALLTRTWGDCYGYYLVATGRADIMIDPALHLWDAVAAKPIIEEAGGLFYDWSGQAKTDAGDAVAANSVIMPQVLKILQQRQDLT